MCLSFAGDNDDEMELQQPIEGQCLVGAHVGRYPRGGLERWPH